MGRLTDRQEGTTETRRENYKQILCPSEQPTLLKMYPWQLWGEEGSRLAAERGLNCFFQSLFCPPTFNMGAQFLHEFRKGKGSWEEGDHS